MIAQVLALLAGLVSAALLSRGLGLEGYGLLGVIFATVTPVAWIAASLLAGRTAVKLVSGARRPSNMASQLIHLNLWIGAVFCLLFSASSPLAAGWLGQPEIIGFLILAGAEIFLLPLARTHHSALIGLGSYSHAGASPLVFHLIRLGLIVVLMGFGMTLAGAILAFVAGRVAEILWYRWRYAFSLFVPIHIRFSEIRGLSPAPNSTNKPTSDTVQSV